MCSPLRLWTAYFMVITLWTASAQVDYIVGVGRADVTGPAAEINFMGYANLQQSGRGIHIRQFARCYIIEKNGIRIVFVSCDIAAMGTALKREVITRLQQDYGNLYDTRNVIISGTHTHSTPGGFLVDFLYDLSIFGFVRETFNAYAAGIVRCIKNAHENTQPGRLFYSENDVADAQINRSPTSYLRNPEVERNRYPGNIDTKMQQIKITTTDRELLGVINWFAVHAVSMNNTNTLISSDNVGYAAQVMEKAINPTGTLPGKGQVVAAIASSNLGDVSPNIRGPRCQTTGNICDISSSTCSLGQCYASGPGEDMFDSTKIIGERIAQVAINMLGVSWYDREIKGSVKIIHQFVNMPEQIVPNYDPIQGTFNQSNTVGGCVPAMGFSFAAGTTDGPGLFNYSQQVATLNPLFDIFSSLIPIPPLSDISCHAPKPILLLTGRILLPYEWQPNIVATQLAMIGNVTIAAVPGEFTTMAGRRLREVIRRQLEANSRNDVVVLAGLCNTYSSYVTTKEEYQELRYEGASTIYGPNTLTIYLNQYNKLVNALLQDNVLPPGPTPPNIDMNILLSLVPPVVFDTAGIGRSFGGVITQPRSSYGPGDVASAIFVSANPRNDVQQESNFGTVERLNLNGQAWEDAFNDASWETKFIWTRTDALLETSSAEIQWTIPEDVEPGTYRFHHRGHAKRALPPQIIAFEGISRSFQVTNP